MKFATVIVTGASLVAVLASASYSQSPKPNSPAQSRPGGQRPSGGDQPVNISGPFSGIRIAKQVVVRDSASFADLWKQHSPSGGAPAPQVDFKKHDVIAVFAGTKNTGGHTIAIDSVDVKDKAATVHVKLHKPGPGTLVPQLITYPFAMKAVAKLPRIVKFDITEATGGP